MEKKKTRPKESFYSCGVGDHQTMKDTTSLFLAPSRKVAP
jgi:hypothetical protein